MDEAPTCTDLTFDELRRLGWSVGTFSFVQAGRVLWSADAIGDDGKRTVVQAEVLAAALLELERQCAEADTAHGHVGLG